LLPVAALNRRRAAVTGPFAGSAALEVGDQVPGHVLIRSDKPLSVGQTEFFWQFPVTPRI